MKRAFFTGLVLAWLPFARVVFDPGLTLLYRDLTNVFLPAKTLWLRAVLELGRLPHWNPFFASGVPFLSDPVMGALHPANLLFLLSPSHPERGLIYFLLFHYFALYIGGYLLARSERVRPWLSMAAGLALCWSGYAISCNSNPHDLAGLIAVPFFFYFLRQRRVLGSSAALAFPVLVGDAQFTYVMLLIAGVLHGRQNPKFLLRIYTTGLLLSAPQLLPALAHFKETSRATWHLADSEQLSWSLHPVRLLELIFPQPFGPRPDFGSYLGYPFTGGRFRMDPFLFSFYPSLYTVLFGGLYAIATFARRRRWRAALNYRFFGYLMILLLTLGTYTPLALPAAHWIPLWGAFRYPERLTFWLAFFAWLAATRGSERILRLTAQGTKPSPLAYAIYIPGAAAVAWWSARAGFPAALISLAAFISCMATLEIGARRLISKHWLAPLCALLLSMEAGLVATRLIWPMPTEIVKPGFSDIQQKIFKDRAANSSVFSRGGAFRLYTLSQGLVNEEEPTEIAARLQFGSMEREMRKAWAYLRYYSGATFGLELAHRQNTLSPAHEIYQREKKSPRDLNRFLDLASVRYLVNEPENKVVVRPTALPYAYFPAYTEGALTPNLIDMLFQESRDPNSTALFDIPAPRLPNPSCWFIQNLARSWDRISFHFVSTGGCGQSTLVVNEAYEPGWHGTFGNHKMAEIQRVNAWAQAINIPPATRAGESLSLELAYREHSFFVGCVLFLVGIGGLL